jgi:hypothetical protein
MIIESKGTAKHFSAPLDTDPADYVRDIRVVMPALSKPTRSRFYSHLFGYVGAA